MLNEEEFIISLKKLWNYMKLDQRIEKSDLIIGCGCANLNIPLKCVQLFKEGYASKILFCGGLGKITKNIFKKPEALIYKEIAIKEGISEKDILTETESTNTGDNFKFSLNILSANNIKYDKIIIVHNKLSERRTLSAAQMFFSNKKLFITSPESTFEDFLNQIKKNPKKAYNTISVMIGDIQRLIIFPQLGWQTPVEVPEEIIKLYKYFKKLGFTKYIFSKEEINNLINKYGIIKGEKANYFN